MNHNKFKKLFWIIKMDYIEKAKYELIMGIKNEESKEVIDVLSKYYNDVVEIVKDSSSVFKYNKIKGNTVNNIPKFMLTLHSAIDTSPNESEKFFFSDEQKVIQFYEKYNLKSRQITILEIENIDTHDLNHSIYDKSYEIWKKELIEKK
jgi:hypothetical protein